MTERLISVIYCDDVRHEEGGKKSFMGIYQGKLLANTFPCVLPRFCTVVTVSTPLENPFEKFSVRLMLGEKEQAKAEMPDEVIRKACEAIASDGQESVIVLQAILEMGNLTLNDGDTLRVFVATEAGELRTPGLAVRLGEASVSGHKVLFSQRTTNTSAPNAS